VAVLRLENVQVIKEDGDGGAEDGHHRRLFNAEEGGAYGPSLIRLVGSAN
jgi:hypothetical protein